MKRFKADILNAKELNCYENGAKNIFISYTCLSHFNLKKTINMK